MDTLLNQAETLERLRIGRTLLWRLEREGRIRGVHIGRRRFYPESEVARFVEAIKADRN